MKRVFLYIVLSLLILVSCSGGKGKIIPKSDMKKIYAEMFLVDQKLYRNRNIQRSADTLAVYAVIFKKYGYTVEDYNASVAHYLDDPERFARILRESASYMDKEIKELKKEKERLAALEKEVKSYQPKKIYFLTGLGNPNLSSLDSLTFYVDSTGGEVYFDVRKWMDTVYFGPEIVIDSLDTVSDSLSVGADSSGIVQDKHEDVLELKNLVVPVTAERRGKPELHKPQWRRSEK